jgi:glycosyltransferase involved in cell wall biosynthesis
MTRKKVGLSFTFNNETNCAVVNYIYFVVHALNTLPDKDKPHLVIFYTDGSHLDYIEEINYPYIEYYYTTTDIDVPSNVADYIYPYYSFEPQFKNIENKIRWLVDFNVHYFPEHFTESDRVHVIAYEKEIIESELHTVLSSYDAFDDLKKFYPNYKNKITILRFAITLHSFEEVNKEEVLKRYGINEPYFMTPNQLWAHKNHIVILKAMKSLIDIGYDCQAIFTGPRRDGRTKNYFPDLQDFVVKNGLEEKVKFLGLIDRREQLCLMKNAVSIIQPSLLEGWSTLVEECKSLNKNIIISNLDIHKEQINKNCMFFNPYESDELMECMEKVLNGKFREVQYDYSNNVKDFGKELLTIFN